MDLDKPSSSFAPLEVEELSGGSGFRRVRVPSHRLTPLREHWDEIYSPVVGELHLEIRMNLHNRCIELRECSATRDAHALQKGADFVGAFVLGFDVDDALALVRLDDLYIDSFDISDVKTLKGDHMSRAIGRVAGKGGRTRFAIENCTKTRIVLADRKVHILGSFSNIRIARDAVAALILGSPPGKVYERLESLSSRSDRRML